MSTTTAVADTVIRARGLVLAKGGAPFDFDLVRGKVIGLAGLEGHGQQDLLTVLCGITQPVEGILESDVMTLRNGRLRSQREAFKKGIAYVPRDRRTQGIFPSLSVLDNFAVATLRSNSRFGVLNTRRIRRRYDEFAGELGIVTAGPGTLIRALSGGNQQKVLLARWLAAEPRVLLLNDPSRGVDHPTKLSLYGLYRAIADRGACVVLLSTEIEELLIAADEIVVFREKSVSARITAADRDHDQVLGAMFGATDE